MILLPIFLFLLAGCISPFGSKEKHTDIKIEFKFDEGIEDDKEEHLQKSESV
jgi:hypothetical protein